MSSYNEDLQTERNARKKLGRDFLYANIESILDDAHCLRESDHVQFEEALNIAAGKTRSPYGTRNFD